MEPITYMFNMVNRHVISIKPKQPMLDWINAIYPPKESLGPDMPEDGNEASAYLVKEYPDPDVTEKWLRKNFGEIFENELNERHQDEDDWPKKRTWKMFIEWFDTGIYPAVYDIEKGMLRKSGG